MRTLILAALAAFMLTACGGGDPEDDTKDTQPVNCQAKPEACK